MTSILVLGDLAPALTVVPSDGFHDATASATPKFDPTLIAVALDLTIVHHRAEAKLILRQATEDAGRAARRYGRVRHIVIAVRLSGRARVRFETMASRIATHLHAALERSIGRDIECTILDITDCTDANALASRLRERASDPAGAHGVIVLGWHDIAHRTIARAAREEYF